MGLAYCLLVGVQEDGLLVAGHVVEEGPCGYLLLFDDVAEGPPAAWPGVGEVGGGPVVGHHPGADEAAGLGLLDELLGVYVEGCG